LISQGVHPLWGVKQVQGGENTLFSRKMRQYHCPDVAVRAAVGCSITSSKSLFCLQLVFTSKWSNFRHACASHGFVSASWLSCITQFYQFMSFLEILKLIHFGLCNQYQIPKFKRFGNWDDLIDQLKLESTQ